MSCFSITALLLEPMFNPQFPTMSFPTEVRKTHIKLAMFSIYRMFHWTNPMVGESHRSNCCSPGPVALWPFVFAPVTHSHGWPPLGHFLQGSAIFHVPLQAHLTLKSCWNLHKKTSWKAALDTEMTAMNHATQICSNGTSVSPNLLIGSGRNLKGIPATASPFSGWAWVC